jgi:DNA-binding NtrC family response regulator
VRLIAATNRDLSEASRSGEFRQDLFYRLAVVRLTMPPLRERKEDIPMLTRHFVQKQAKRCKVKARPVSAEAMSALKSYDWPGNVRELENAIERALVMGASEMLLLEDLPESLLEQNTPAAMDAGKYHGGIRDLKKKLIMEAVSQTGGNYVEAARILGVHPNYLHRLIRGLEMKDEINDALRRRGKGGAA